MRDLLVVSLWSTSSFDVATETSPTELLSLRDHMRHCGSVRGRFFQLRCIADAFAEFLGTRVITTILVMTLSAIAVTQL